MKRLALCAYLLTFTFVFAAAAQDAAHVSPAAPPAVEHPHAPAAGLAPAGQPAPVEQPEARPVAAAARASTAAEAPAAQPKPPVDAPSASAIQTAAEAPPPTRILLPHDLSPWSMFLSADVIVKAVMIGLAFASLMTWTIFFAKTVEFAVARRRLRRGLERLDGKSFAEAKLALGKPDGVLRSFLDVADRELSLSERRMWDTGAKERCESEIAELVRNELQSMRRGMPLLATVGSTAPFVGLFGTVWGIMNAFIGISKAQTTNLAVVAPGIAEALLATAIGLVAAIPAVVIYNHFSQSGRRYQHLVAKASGTVQRMMSREFDRRLATTRSAE